MSLKSIITNKKASGTTALLAQRIQSNILDNNVIPSGINQMAISMEDSEHSMAELSRTASELGDSLEGIRASFEDEGLEAITTSAQLTAGQLAGIVAGDVGSFMNRKMIPMRSSGKNTFVVGTASMEDAYDGYSASLEAYDDRETKNAVLYAITYNIQASRQDDFGEAFFPTVVVSPDEVGLSIETRVVYVYNDFQRSASGSTDGSKFAAINVLRAYRDASILGNESTKIIPVQSAASAALFNAETTLNSNITDAAGTVVPTGFLNFDTPLSLLGVSQTADMLAKGIMDSTDSLSPMLNLDSVAISVGATADSNKFAVVTVNGLPKSNFTYSTQGSDRELNLAFDSSSIIVSTNTLATTGTTWNMFAGVTAGVSAKLGMSIYGSSQVETGDTNLFGNSITLIDVYDANGNVLAAGNADYDAIAAKVAAGMTLQGYTLEGYRTNANRRDRGRLIKSNNFVQSYAVPVRAPVTVLRPTGANDDMSDLKALVNVTQVRTSNSAVKALVDAAATLKAVVNAGQTDVDVLGVGRFLIQPFYKHVNLNMLAAVDSMTSTDRANDIQSALLNTIRDSVYRMYYQTQYQVAADSIAGGKAARPTVIIGTDTVIGRYLDTNTNIKILSNTFDVKVVTSLDTRVEGKMFISFGVFDSSRNEAVNPLNFGCMAWAPEVTANLQISRSGQTSKEISVQPRFRHIVNLPAMIEYSVTNIDQITGKVHQSTRV